MPWGERFHDEAAGMGYGVGDLDAADGCTDDDDDGGEDPVEAVDAESVGNHSVDMDSDGCEVQGEKA